MKNIAFERMSLRNLNRDDVEPFYTWAGDPEVAKTMTWEAYTSKEDALKFLKEVAEWHPWFKAICVDGIPVGSITLNLGKELASQKADMGYVISKANWGKGIATHAVRLALKSVNELNIRSIEAFVDPDNIASQKVLLKSGFHFDAHLKDHLLFKGTLRDRLKYTFTLKA